ncbi:hypothetical protein I4U23_010323 [Adineta vaga]|nr:hypothetical protein I4U23_010323 [Adineta vaga]
MTETSSESSIIEVESTVLLPDLSSTSALSSSSPTNPVDEEAKRRRILSKLWGKGNKSSHKVRELEKTTTNNSSDSLTHHDNDQQVTDNSNNLSSYPTTNDSKSSTEDNSNSINSSKPLAVVKPIVVVKSGLIVSHAVDRTYVNSEAPSPNSNQIDETATTSTVSERQSTTTTKETSNKKKKHHKNDDSKKKKSTRDKSSERDRSHRHQTDDSTSKKNSSSTKDHRREQKDEINNNHHHKSSRHHSSATSNNRRRSPSQDTNSKDRKSSRSVTSRKEESLSKKSNSSPHDRHSKSNHNSSHRRGLSIILSPSPSRSRHSATVTTTDRLTTKNTLSPKKDDRTSKSSRQTTESITNSKSTNSISSSDSQNNKNHQPASSETNNDKTRTNDTNITKSSKPEENSPKPQSSNKQEKSKSTNEHDSQRRKSSSSARPDRHCSKSHETKSDRKIIEPSSSNDSSLNKTKTNHETNNHDKKSSRGSSIPSTHDDHHGRRRRRRSSDYHRHDSPLRHDRRSDHYRRHRSPHYSNTHYVHHHHHHHYRSTSSRYRHHRRRSSSPRSHQHRSRYSSSTSSSSLSFSPRRRSRSRTSYSSTRSSSSYSSISRTSSSTSRSSSRNNHYYHHHHHEKKFRRSPTLEKLFLKASESIEAVSTQKNPNLPSSSLSTTKHFLSIPPTNTTSDMPMTSLSEPNAFYPETFAGFSAPPPPFNLPPQQRCLKEITTDTLTTRRTVFNEIPTVPSSIYDEISSDKNLQPNDSSSNGNSFDLNRNFLYSKLLVRPPSSKPPRVSRFSDITSTTPSEAVLNTNIPVDTLLNYTQINENINCLPSSRRQQKRHNREVMECECTTSECDRSHGIKACGSDCLNRMLLIECGPMCPCGQWCSNRRFQRRSYASHKIGLFKTEMKGYGLQATSKIRKGRFLVEYIGEVIDMDELGKRNKKYKRDGNIHQYVMSLIHGTVIDSTMKGNWARFINHSCEPNCVAEKWLVNGEYRMGIFAKRDLDINEELTIDYRFESSNSADLANEKCYCGAPTCRGTISIKSNQNNNNSLKRQNRRATLDDDELLDYLRDEDTNEYLIPKTIDEIRQLIQIMSRTDSENVRTIELDLIKTSSQKHVVLPRLFLECNGLHVLCSWMKDILINDDEHDQQQYSDEFKYQLLDFIHTVLPIKDRTIVIKNGLFDLVFKQLRLPSKINDQIEMTDQEQIHSLMNTMLDHLENPIITKLFHIYSTWSSLKERFIIPKRKEPESSSYHRHHHHHHHSSKHRYEEENSSRLSFPTRSSYSQQKPFDRSFSRRSYVLRETPRTQEQLLSKDERRKLFEQQYEDEEKARAAAAAAATTNGESPGSQNEPPHKKQRTSDNDESMIPHTPPQPESSSSTAHPDQTDQTYWIYQHLSQIPIEYIRSYMTSAGIKDNSQSTTSIDKDELPLPPPARPENEVELSRIIRLPSGWSVATCPTDSSVYFYNRETMTTSWTLPSTETTTDTSAPPIDLSPLSSAHIISEQRRPHHHHHHHSLLHANMKLSKHLHRHSRNHRHHHISNSNKRKRPPTVDSTTAIKEEIDDTSKMTPNETKPLEQEEDDDEEDDAEQMSSTVPKIVSEENNEIKQSSSEINDHNEESITSNANILSSIKQNRDHLRKNISQHVHATLKPYTKRTCKQGRIVSTDDIKYLVKKFTLAVLDKEIEKAKNDAIPLSTILTDRVRLKTELYVKKYMNKMGPVFQRHDASTSHPNSSISQTVVSLQATTSNSE